MRLILFFVTLSIPVMNVHAQTKKERDRQAIKSMCGCYEVSFNFAETFHYAQDSAYQPSPVKHDHALEWVQLISDTDDKVSIQHILVIEKPSDPHIIKHWRQDWLFENTLFYQYEVGRKWKFVERSKREVTGQWTQKVFQIDDSPRYEGTASWVHVDGKTYWENTTYAPLPRREYTRRSDYNVMVRRNRHEITPRGWIHDQYNDKVVRKVAETDVVLAQEKGYNSYMRVDDDRCKAARDWWNQNTTKWQLVRKHWDVVFSRKQDLELLSKVEGNHLSEHLHDLNDAANEQAVADVIDAFVKQ